VPDSLQASSCFSRTSRLHRWGWASTPSTVWANAPLLFWHFGVSLGVEPAPKRTDPIFAREYESAGKASQLTIAPEKLSRALLLESAVFDISASLDVRQATVFILSMLVIDARR
jgi:hypothetical protein